MAVFLRTWGPSMPCQLQVGQAKGDAELQEAESSQSKSREENTAGKMTRSFHCMDSAADFWGHLGYEA